jgi:hypothetical protein
MKGILMKKFLISFITLVSLLTFSRNASFAEQMNREGSCVGESEDGQKIDFNYYSDFNGCLRPSRASLVFLTDSRISGLTTGVRSVPSDQLDAYEFTAQISNQNVVIYRLNVNQTSVSAPSQFFYRKVNPDGSSREITVNVRCHVQMYAYIPCREN